MAFLLPRLPRNTALIDKNGYPTQAFQMWWQTFAKNIESEVGALAAADAANAAAAAANAAAASASSAATTANSAATAAQSTADAIQLEAELVNSYVTGLTLGATDAGASASISISAHSRVYGNGTSVSVNSGSLTGLSYSTAYYIYYDQVSRAGGAVTYASTTTAATSAQTGNRHFVGVITTPAAAAGPTSGYGVSPPGIGDVYIP